MPTSHQDICRYLSIIAAGSTPEENLTDCFCSEELSAVSDRFTLLSLEIERFKACNMALVEQNQRVRDSEHLYRSIFENSVVGILIVSESGVIININQAAEYMLGYQAEDLRLMNISDVTLPEDYSMDAELLQDLLEGRRTYYQVEKRYVRNDGILFWGMVTVSVERDESGKPNIINMVEDITARKSAESQLEEASTRDGLTGLFNRSFFDKEFTSLQYSIRLPISIIMVDVDGLKLINDTKGHEAGDRLITGVAAILKEAFRGDDTIARVGGDEFSVLLPETGEDALKTVLERLRKCQSRFNVASPDFQVQFSVGSATAHKGAELPQALKTADQRMYAEKALHKSAKSE